MKSCSPSFPLSGVYQPHLGRRHFAWAFACCNTRHKLFQKSNIMKRYNVSIRIIHYILSLFFSREINYLSLYEHLFQTWTGKKNDLKVFIICLFLWRMVILQCINGYEIYVITLAIFCTIYGYKSRYMRDFIAIIEIFVENRDITFSCVRKTFKLARVRTVCMFMIRAVYTVQEYVVKSHNTVELKYSLSLIKTLLIQHFFQFVWANRF